MTTGSKLLTEMTDRSREVFRRVVEGYLRNGEPMSVRDKGPLWVVYNFDSNPEFQTEVMYSRSIWQLDRIVVE